MPKGTTIRTIGAASNNGMTKYMVNRYLKERGDANIKSMQDLIDKSKFYRDIRPDAGFIDRKAALEEINSSMTLDLANIFQDRFANQQIMLQCMAEQNLDALVSPAGNIPAYILGSPSSRRWREGPIRSGGFWANTAFRHCRCRRVSRRTCSTASAILRLATGRGSRAPSGKTSARDHVLRQAVLGTDASCGSLRPTRR